MFNVGSGEFLVIMLLALVVLGPTRLPEALRQLGRFIGEARRLSTNFQNEVNETMKDPVKKATGYEIPKLPSNGRELVDSALPGPFDAIENAEPKEDSADDDASKPTTNKPATINGTGDPEVETALPAKPTSVEPSQIPPKLGTFGSESGQTIAASKGHAADAGNDERDEDEDEEVPMFGDR